MLGLTYDFSTKLVYRIWLNGHVEEAYVDLVEFLDGIETFAGRYANRLGVWDGLL